VNRKAALVSAKGWRRLVARHPLLCFEAVRRISGLMWGLKCVDLERRVVGRGATRNKGADGACGG